MKTKKCGFDILQICIDCNKVISTYTTESDITSVISSSLNCEDVELQMKVIKFISSVICYINNKSSTNFLQLEVFDEIFKFRKKGVEVRREVVYFLCNISSFDPPVIIKLISKGYFSIINELFKEVHSFSKGLLLSALWVIFIKARTKGYSTEREMTKEYLKVGGMEMIKELEKSPHKGIKERVVF
jgi:hypothetical protein